MIRPSQVMQQHQQSDRHVFDQDRSRRHILPFPFRISRPEKKVSVAIKEYAASSPPVSTKTSLESAPSNADKDKVNDTYELSKQFEKSHFARVRARFVVPCILVRGKNICRSATLSNEVEVFMHSVNQKINDLNQKRKMFLYGTGERSPDKEDRESSLEKQRMEDIELLHQLGVTYINDLMVENRKVKYGLKVTSSEKVDSFGRYSKFKLVATPYPGVEFFQKFKANKYSARKLCFDWSQNFADAELQLPAGHTDNLGIQWRDYKSWDLIELTQNYLRLYLTHIADDTVDSDLLSTGKGTAATASKGLLIHCISADRSQRGEDIFYFCFYFLKFIYDEEFSLKSVSNVSKNGKRSHRHSFSTQPVSSHSQLAKDIGRIRGEYGTSAGSQDSHDFICNECMLAKKSPNEPLGRNTTPIKNNSQEAASSTDGKSSSWQLITFSTPPGRDKHGSPRAPFASTLQTIAKPSGSPLGARRNPYMTGFAENTGHRTSVLDQEVLDGDDLAPTSSPASLDARFLLGVQQFNARRSSSSGIPDLPAEESRRTTQGISGLEISRVATSPNLFAGNLAEGADKESSFNNNVEAIGEERQSTPRKRASTFDGGLLLSTGQGVPTAEDDLDSKEQEEDLTSGDDDNGDEGPAPDGCSPSHAPEPQICLVCHHTFLAGPKQPDDHPMTIEDSVTTSRPLIPLNSDALNIPQQPMGVSPRQALERMRVVDRLFSQEDEEQVCPHHRDQNPIVETDRDEGMFQLEFEDRPSYPPRPFLRDGKSDLGCLDHPCHSGSVCQEGSLSSDSCVERDTDIRGRSSLADEPESIEGEENESFWDETSTVDYGCSPGSMLNGFGLGLTKCTPDHDGDLSLDSVQDIGRDASGSIRDEDEDDDDDDDDDDGAASLNSRQNGTKMDHRENDHLFMPSLKGVFSHADRFGHERGRLQEGPSANDAYLTSNTQGTLTGDTIHPLNAATSAAGAWDTADSAQSTIPGTPRTLTRRQKLKQLRRLFMDIRSEIGDGNRSPSRSTSESRNTKGVPIHSATEEEDDSGGSFQATSFSDDSSFTYRSPIAVSAAFARHGSGMISSSTTASKRQEIDLSQPFFARRQSSSRQSGEPTIFSPMERPHYHQPHQPQGLVVPPSSGRKSPFEWAAAAASSAAASISSSASGIVSGGFGHPSSSSISTRQSPFMKPSTMHPSLYQHQQHRSPTGSGHYNRSFTLPEAHNQLFHQNSQHPSYSGVGHYNHGGNSSGLSSTSISRTTTPMGECHDFGASSPPTMLSMSGERLSATCGHGGAASGTDSIRRRSLVPSSTTSPASSTSRIRGTAESSGRWDW
ncbi:Myotubularin- protein 14 [Mortierella claussenii]|nr:Myotubularin- protein 14 [Mortierella claussenii]